MDQQGFCRFLTCYVCPVFFFFFLGGGGGGLTEFRARAFDGLEVSNQGVMLVCVLLVRILAPSFVISLAQDGTKSKSSTGSEGSE